MYYLLLGALAIVAVLVTYFVTKKIAWNKGYLNGELSEREKHHFGEDATIKWDSNRMVLKGLNPLKGVNVYEDKKLLDKESEIPQFGINLKYNPNDEEPATRHFDVNIYCDYTNKVNKNIIIYPDGSVSDGYHTFEELYNYRLTYNAAFINSLQIVFNSDFHKYKGFDIIKSKKHSDGKLCFDGKWFIVVIKTPYGQISNHYELEHWDKFHCRSVKKAWVYDGHTPEDALKRLDKLSNYISTGKWL